MKTVHSLFASVLLGSIAWSNQNTSPSNFTNQEEQQREAEAGLTPYSSNFTNQEEQREVEARLILKFNNAIHSSDPIDNAAQNFITKYLCEPEHVDPYSGVSSFSTKATIIQSWPIIKHYSSNAWESDTDPLTADSLIAHWDRIHIEGTNHRSVGQQNESNCLPIPYDDVEGRDFQFFTIDGHHTSLRREFSHCATGDDFSDRLNRIEEGEDSWIGIYFDLIDILKQVIQHERAI